MSDLTAKAPRTPRNIEEPSPEVDAIAHAVIGAALEVHRIFGPGYLESVYEESLAIEFKPQNISFEQQKPLGLNYKGHSVGEHRLDFLVGQKLVVELKAVDSIAPVHKAQVISYLKSTGLNLGLLINFNVELLKNGIQRIVLS